jgi:hypothetical protein
MGEACDRMAAAEEASDLAMKTAINRPQMAEPVQRGGSRGGERSDLMRPKSHCFYSLVSAGRWQAFAIGKLDPRSGTEIERYKLAGCPGKRSRAMLSISGTSKVEHLEENLKAPELEITAATLNDLARSASA